MKKYILLMFILCITVSSTTLSYARDEYIVDEELLNSNYKYWLIFYTESSNEYLIVSSNSEILASESNGYVLPTGATEFNVTELKYNSSTNKLEYKFGADDNTFIDVPNGKFLNTYLTLNELIYTNYDVPLMLYSNGVYKASKAILYPKGYVGEYHPTVEDDTEINNDYTDIINSIKTLTFSVNVILIVELFKMMKIYLFRYRKGARIWKL